MAPARARPPLVRTRCREHLRNHDPAAEALGLRWRRCRLALGFFWSGKSAPTSSSPIRAPCENVSSPPGDGVSRPRTRVTRSKIKSKCFYAGGICLPWFFSARRRDDNSRRRSSSSFHPLVALSVFQLCDALHSGLWRYSSSYRACPWACRSRRNRRAVLAVLVARFVGLYIVHSQR